MTVQDLYNAIDAFAPFAAQERWDNSGILVGSPGQSAGKALVTLDISLKAVERAAAEGCDIIISHHPVIFEPLKHLTAEHPVYQMARHGIAGICCHTPLDLAEGGINDLTMDCLRTRMPQAEAVGTLTADGWGRLMIFPEPVTLADVAEQAKLALGCKVVRCSPELSRRIRRLGICCGSAASMLEEVAGSCDAFLTGDVKHDRWYKAEELGVSLIDCGHYHTERLMVESTAQKLKEALPTLEVVPFVEEDPCVYL